MNHSIIEIGIGERRLEIGARQIRPRECAFILNGRAARSTSLVAICRHRGLVAEDIVGVADRVGLQNLVTAVPPRGSHLTGEVFERRALAFCVVCHAVSGDSIPHSINVRFGTRFDFLAARIGDRDVAGCFAGDGRGGLLVEVGDGFSPEVGREIP